MKRKLIAGFVSICLLTIALKKTIEMYHFYLHAPSVAILMGANGGGTSFQLKVGEDEQYTVTNDHVCGLADERGMLIVQSPYTRVQKIKVLYKSEDTDLCLLTPIMDLPPLTMATAPLSIGDKINIYGFPLLGPLTLSPGKIEQYETIDVGEFELFPGDDASKCTGAKHRVEWMLPGIIGVCIARVGAMRSDAEIEPGNSGSPVVNKNYEVVAVAFAGSFDSKSSYLIPLNDLKRVIYIYKHRP